MTEGSKLICGKCGKAVARRSHLVTHEKFCGRKLDAEYFWPRVDRSGGPNACWLWTGAKTGHPHGCGGYGVINFKRKAYGAHKVAWTITNGPVAKGLYVLHKCDVRHCCNPAHLFLGTHKDNMDDMTAKGRRAHHKLTLEKASQIKQRFIPRGNGNGIGNAGELAKEFGVKYGTVHAIVTGKYWRQA